MASLTRPPCTPTSAVSPELRMLRKGRFSALPRGPRACFTSQHPLHQVGNRHRLRQEITNISDFGLTSETRNQEESPSQASSDLQRLRTSSAAGPSQKTTSLRSVRQVLPGPGLQRALALFHGEVSFYPSSFLVWFYSVASSARLSIVHFLPKSTPAGFCSCHLKTPLPPSPFRALGSG